MKTSLTCLLFVLMLQPCRAQNINTLRGHGQEVSGKVHPGIDLRLKSSFWEALYLAGAADVNRDSLQVVIPFDLHSPDCGAPDCYTTEVRFSVSLATGRLLPSVLHYREREYGCRSKPAISSRFRLMEQGREYVIYYAIERRSALVLFRSAERTGTLAYYFSDVPKGSINGKNVFRIVNEYDEGNERALYPYISRSLTTER